LIREAVCYYLERMRTGDTEDPFFGLLDLGPRALPLLIAEANKIENRPIRAMLVEVIWQYRSPEAIDFLGEALSDPDPRVWKQALDGMVAIGGPAAIRWIRTTAERVASGAIRNGLSADWLSEALEQVGTAGPALP
jgi:hypothetical protein